MRCPQNVLYGDENANEWLSTRWDETSWQDAWGPMPRACSYCGGGHIDDLIVLIEQHGWEIEPSDKPYKWYSNEPGYSKVPRASNHVSVTPPAKLYSYHCVAQTQVDKLNSLLLAQRLAAVTK